MGGQVIDRVVPMDFWLICAWILFVPAFVLGGESAGGPLSNKESQSSRPDES